MIVLIEAIALTFLGITLEMAAMFLRLLWGTMRGTSESANFHHVFAGFRCGSLSAMTEPLLSLESYYQFVRLSILASQGTLSVFQRGL